jgi:hypothetical protein
MLKQLVLLRHPGAGRDLSLGSRLSGNIWQASALRCGFRPAPE